MGKSKKFAHFSCKSFIKIFQNFFWNFFFGKTPYCGLNVVWNHQPLTNGTMRTLGETCQNFFWNLFGKLFAPQNQKNPRRGGGVTEGEGGDGGVGYLLLVNANISTANVATMMMKSASYLFAQSMAIKTATAKSNASQMAFCLVII